MIVPGGGGELRFLDPAVIGRLGTLELKARTIVEGVLSGLHRSPFRGFSNEFAEYRQYMQGDDLSTLDWKVYARSDRHYVKKYEQETNLACHILLDTSASMGYASDGVTKFEYASYLAAALAYLMHRQRDAVGFMAFDYRVAAMLPASARPGHLRSLLLALDGVKLGERSDVSKPLHLLADMMVKRGMVVLISDLLDDPSRVVTGLKHLRFKGSDVLVFHVVDRAERTFPFDRMARFKDMESEDEVMAVPAMVRDEYLKAFGDMTSFYERELRLAGIDYRLLESSQPLDFALLAYLATRAKR